MLQDAYTFFSPLLIVACQSLLIAWTTLTLICKATPAALRFLYICSGKSSTNARLLGGLSISLSLAAGCAVILMAFPGTLTPIEKKLFLSAMLSIFLITVYGYIDDKFEVRVRFKLTLQLLSIFSFAFFTANLISPEHFTEAFIFSSVLGLALINGTNLLDGLDTLAVKLGVGISFAFLYLGFLSQSYATIVLSVSLIASLTMFYFFNKEPAKVYMGEIGGGIMGFVFYAQSTLCISKLQVQIGLIDAVCLALIACSFPIFELAISFGRRICCKKSPFRGDRLHLHYILKSKLQLSASKASSRMGIACLSILMTGLVIADFWGPIAGIFTVSLFTIFGYLKICLADWKGHLKVDSTQHVFSAFEGKKIRIINSDAANELDFTLTNRNINSDKQKAA